MEFVCTRPARPRLPLPASNVTLLHTSPTCARREGVCLTTADLTRAPPPRLQREGWGEKVDKEHHLKMDGFMRHADKCLQLGEKPFVSGGMKGGAK